MVKSLYCSRKKLYSDSVSINTQTLLNKTLQTVLQGRLQFQHDLNVAVEWIELLINVQESVIQV
jgi:hypothetical protein